MKNHTAIEPINPRQKFLRTLPWLVKLGLSSGLVWYLLGKVGSSSVKDQVLALSPLILCLALGLIVLQAIMAGIRWSLVVSAIGHNLKLVQAINITFVSLFFNQVLPASVGGDAIRMWQSRKAGLPLNAAVTSVMLERFGNLLTLATLSVAMLPTLAARHPDPVMSQGMTLVALSGLAMLLCLMFLDRLPSSWHSFRIIRGVGHLARDTRALFLHPVKASYMILTALAGQFLLAAATFILARGMGLSISVSECLAIMPAVVIVSSLPISVAGWGVRELAMVTAFGIVGVKPEAALALSITLAIIGSAASLPGGVVFAIYKIGGFNTDEKPNLITNNS